MRIRRKYGIAFCLLRAKTAYPFVILILVSLNECVTAAINITLTLLFPNCSDYTNHQKQCPCNFVCLYIIMLDALKHISREL